MPGEELRYKIDTSILVHSNGPVTNTARILGQSGLTVPNQVFTTAQRISIVSTDANDTVAGTGVQKVLIKGYKDNEFASEEVDMSGTVAATTTDSFDEIHSAEVTQIGTGSQGGDITISVSGGSTIFKMVQGFLGINEAMLFTKKILYADHIDVTGDSTDSNTIYEISIMSRRGNENVVEHTFYWDTEKSIHDYTLDHIRLTGLIWVRCDNLKHNGPDNVSASLHLHMIIDEESPREQLSY